jgi:hypothetical protein
MGKTEKIPGYTINPMFKIFLFEWFMFFVGERLRKKDKNENGTTKEFNVYVLHDSGYSSYRKEYGKLKALFSKKQLINTLFEIKGIDLVGDYTDNKIIFISLINNDFGPTGMV